jgi:hypothetical protein
MIYMPNTDPARREGFGTSLKHISIYKYVTRVWAMGSLVVIEWFWWQKINKGLEAFLFARSETLRFFYLWCMLKGKAYINNSCTKNKLKKSIKNILFPVLTVGLHCKMNSVFVTCDTQYMQKVKHSLCRPWGLQEVEAPRFHNIRHMKVVRL